MSRCAFLESKKWITGICLLILRVCSERLLIENGKRLAHNTTKQVTALSKIECVAYCVLSPICCSVSYNNVSSQCVLDQSSCCDVETAVEHNTMLIQNGYMDFIFANHTAEGCEEEWMLNNGHCYYIVEADLNWADAQEDCRSNGANLVTIESTDENQWLRSVLIPGKDYWIGGNDLETEGNWVWISHGCPIKFNYWRKNEPSNTRGVQHCAQMPPVSDNQWDDTDCMNLDFYICEK